MIEYTGRYGRCRVMADSIEKSADEQILEFLNSPAAEGSEVVMMPDVHAGAWVTVGMTATLTDKVIPTMIGVDIGCGVVTYTFPFNDTLNSLPDRLKQLDDHIRANVPSGFSKHEKAVVEKSSGNEEALLIHVEDVAERTGQDKSSVLKSLGTLGGGNHFIEFGISGGTGYLTIHSGSRNFGFRIATYYQYKAREKLGNRGGLEWLDGQDMVDYLSDMSVAQDYADLNRRIMAKTILPIFGAREGDLYKTGCRIQSVHNYIDLSDRVIRKGAISAKKGQMVVIPWNMRDGLIIGEGLGNPDWNYSAPHGAGRLMSRGEAKRSLSVEAFQKTMSDAGIWTSCVGKNTLDESPMAYKPADQILNEIGPTVRVSHTIKPVYNFKAS